MDNNSNENNTDKYTNYTYQGGSADNYSTPNAYSAPYSEPAQYSQPDTYSQPDAYSQPNTYSQPDTYSQPNTYSQPGQYEQYSYSGTVEDTAPRRAGKGPAIASMACGIASLCLAYFGFIPGIVALILSSKFRTANGGTDIGFSKAGKICGIIGIIVSALWILIYIIIIAVGIAISTQGMRSI